MECTVFEISRRNAGLICFGFTKWDHDWTFHFLVRDDCQQWGRKERWFGRPIYRFLHSFGLGPFFLLCWHDRMFFPTVEDAPDLPDLDVRVDYTTSATEKVNWKEEGF